MIFRCIYGTRSRVSNNTPMIILWISKSPFPVGWGSRIHRLHLCRGVSPHPPNECPGYDTKQSDGETPIMLELWEIGSTPSLPLLPCPLLLSRLGRYNKSTTLLKTVKAPPPTSVLNITLNNPMVRFQ